MTPNVIGEKILKLHTPFKDAIKPVLAYEIRSQHYKDNINEKTVFYARKQSYIKVQVDNNEVTISGVDELSCSHNEADTRILWHARYAAENTSSPHIVVRANNTGIFILLFHFVSQLDDQIWMNTGSSYLKTRVSSMAIVCAALPGFHVFTGSHYTASFMRKGKVHPFDVMMQNEEFLHTFTRLGRSDLVSSEVSATLECYVWLSMVSPIHQELMQRDTKYSAKCMLHILVTNHYKIRRIMLFVTLQSHTPIT